MQLMETRLVRDARQVEENKRTIVTFLRTPMPAFSLDDAGATCSAGYNLGIAVPWNPRDKQPMGYEELVSWGHLDPVPATQYDVEPDACPSPASSPRWEQDVVSFEERERRRYEKRFPRYLREGVPRAISRLPRFDQEIVNLCGAKWMSFRAAAQVLRSTHPTVSAHYFAALDAIEQAVFDDDGVGRIG